MDGNAGGQPGAIASLVDYQKGSIVSKPILRGPGGSATLFAFSEGQELTEHTTPSEAVILVIDGEAAVEVDGKWSRVATGEMIGLPANVPHAVRAEARFKMLLIMVKP
jgi:quercetin dioxygenase-like cupin family protein